jgi:hypothetical protein
VAVGVASRQRKTAESKGFQRFWAGDFFELFYSWLNEISSALVLFALPKIVGVSDIGRDIVVTLNFDRILGHTGQISQSLRSSFLLLADP